MTKVLYRDTKKKGKGKQKKSLNHSVIPFLKSVFNSFVTRLEQDLYNAAEKPLRLHTLS